MALARLSSVKHDDLMPQVQRFVDSVKNIAGVESVILFGPLARNEMTAASDIDLAIIVDHPSRVKSTKEQASQYLLYGAAIRREKSESGALLPRSGGHTVP